MVKGYALERRELALRGLAFVWRKLCTAQAVSLQNACVTCSHPVLTVAAGSVASLWVHVCLQTVAFLLILGLGGVFLGKPITWSRARSASSAAEHLAKAALRTGNMQVTSAVGDLMDVASGTASGVNGSRDSKANDRVAYSPEDIAAFNARAQKLRKQPCDITFASTAWDIHTKDYQHNYLRVCSCTVPE